MHQISIILISLLNTIYVSRKIINELQVFDDSLYPSQVVLHFVYQMGVNMLRNKSLSLKQGGATSAGMAVWFFGYFYDGTGGQYSPVYPL